MPPDRLSILYLSQMPAIESDALTPPAVQAQDVSDGRIPAAEEDV